MTPSFASSEQRIEAARGDAAGPGRCRPTRERCRRRAARRARSAARSASAAARRRRSVARRTVGEARHPARLSRRAARPTIGRRDVCRSSTRTRIPIRAVRRRARTCASCPAVRRSAAARIVAPGVVCMPPMYVNVGAYVDAGTMVDSHALVGSCAQIGERVHLSAAAQIGGVLEPVNASPVDHRGRRARRRQLRRVRGNHRSRARRARRRRRAHARHAGVRPRATRRSIAPRADQPLEIPEGAVVVPGARPSRAGGAPSSSCRSRRRSS